MKRILGWVLALSLMLSASPSLAGEEGNPVDQLTGAVWMQSSQDNKYALIYGVECAITVEFFVAQKLEQQSNTGSKKKNPKEIISTLSPFEKGWVNAFEGVSRQKIVAMVDDWYTQHPDQLQRPVFSVLWSEFIAPKLQAR